VREGEIKNNKILVILGPTSSGKTGLAVQIAHKYDGEVIGADSRQVYKYMDIGTGKDLEEYILKSKVKGQRSKVIEYHLIDVVHPNAEYNLVKYVRDSQKAIKDVLSRGKLPIICGGTGLYIQALVDGYNLSDAKPDKKLREKLEKLNVSQLFEKLKKINIKFAEKLNDSDRKNRRRLVRYIEISSLKEAKLPIGSLASKKNEDYNYEIIGLNPDKEILLERIYKRIIARLEKEDMVGEVEGLHEKYGVAWKRLIYFGLEYRFITYYLLGKLSYDEMIEKLNIATRQFAKRQLTWFRRWEKQGREIKWFKDGKDALKYLSLKNK
jgi:tRNA dimethylallyltransferase